MNIWLLIVCMALVTYLQRLLPLRSGRETMLPTWARRGLHFVPVAILSALIAAELVPSDGWLAFNLDARILAGLIAIGLAWLTRSTTIIIGGGILVLLLFTT